MADSGLIIEAGIVLAVVLGGVIVGALCVRYMLRMDQPKRRRVRREPPVADGVK